MNALTFVMAIFAVVGAIDALIGNRMGLGKEFERGLKMFGTLALSMSGMLILAPVLANWLEPVLVRVAEALPFDPSIVPASLFAIDMGGAPLAQELASDPTIGLFNGLVVASMMGCTVSFTVPFALGAVKREQHREVLLGLLCGILTIPVGCFAAGLAAGISPLALLIDLCPLLLFSAIIAIGLWKAPKLSVRIFSVVGFLIKILIMLGLAIGIFTFLTGIVILPGAESFESAALVVVNATAVLTGAFPLIKLLSFLLKKPLRLLGKGMGVNEASAKGFLSSLAASMTTFDEMEKMDPRGAVLNSAFAVSAAFVLTDHLAYTIAFHSDYLGYVMLGKVISGILAVLVAMAVSRKLLEKSFASEPKHEKTQENGKEDKQ